MEKYTYKGYTFYATDVTTDKPGTSRPVPVYEIEGLKDACRRPFITSIQGCKDFIDECIQERAPLAPLTPEQQADMDKAWEGALEHMKY